MGNPHTAIFKAAPTRRISASSKGGPMICSPTGNPPPLSPHGMERAGNPSRLMLRTSRVVASRTSSSMPT